MAVRVSVVDPDSRAAFVAYAVEHGADHDDSFTNPEDIKGFDPAAERGVLAWDDHGGVVGAASLMVRGYAERGLARFRVFHAIDPGAYGPLLEGCLADVPGDIGLVFLFLPERCPAAEIVAELGFAETRRASLLRRVHGGGSLPPAEFPDGVVLRAADPERDAAAWAAVANAAFGGDPGRFDVTEEAARSWLRDSRVIRGGSLIALREGRPIGVAVVMSEEAAVIESGVCALETLAVHPDEQGVGLGRALLRSAIAAATGTGFGTVELSTGATNDRALSLYRSEGFDIVDVRICWGKDPRP